MQQPAKTIVFGSQISSMQAFFLKEEFQEHVPPMHRGLSKYIPVDMSPWGGCTPCLKGDIPFREH